MKSKATERSKNFKRISENRVNKILALYNQLKNLTNKSFYEYSDEDIEKIFKVLEDELQETKNVLLDVNKNNSKKRFEL